MRKQRSKRTPVTLTGVQRIDRVMSDGKWRSWEAILWDAQKLPPQALVTADDISAWILSHKYDDRLESRERGGGKYLYIRMVVPEAAVGTSAEGT